MTCAHGSVLQQNKTLELVMSSQATVLEQHARLSANGAAVQLPQPQLAGGETAGAALRGAALTQGLVLPRGSNKAAALEPERRERHRAGKPAADHVQMAARRATEQAQGLLL